MDNMFIHKYCPYIYLTASSPTESIIDPSADHCPECWAKEDRALLCRKTAGK